MQTPSTPMGSCTVPATPTDSGNPLTNNRMHLDLLVNAFACDITRVAGIQYGNDQYLKVDLPDVPLSGNVHADFIHSGASESFARLAKFEAWLAGEFAYLVQQLKTRDEADGSGKLLDNTLVVWCRDFGDADQHWQYSMSSCWRAAPTSTSRPAPMGRYVKGTGTKSAAATDPGRPPRAHPARTSARRWASPATPASATRASAPTRSRTRTSRSDRHALRRAALSRRPSAVSSVVQRRAEREAHVVAEARGALAAALARVDVEELAGHGDDLLARARRGRSPCRR